MFMSATALVRLSLIQAAPGADFHHIRAAREETGARTAPLRLMAAQAAVAQKIVAPTALTEARADEAMMAAYAVHPPTAARVATSMAAAAAGIAPAAVRLQLAETAAQAPVQQLTAVPAAAPLAQSVATGVL